MRMLPMSLWETKESNGKIPLSELFDNPTFDIDGITSEMEIENLIYAGCRGGWPATMNMKNDKAKLLVARNYVNTVCKEDISRIDNVRRNERVTREIMCSYARNISTLAKNTSIFADVTQSGENTIGKTAFDEYLTALKRLFVISDIEHGVQPSAVRQPSAAAINARL